MSILEDISALAIILIVIWLVSSKLNKKLEGIMTIEADVKASVDALTAGVDQLIALADDIFKKLQDLINAGTPIDSATLQAAIDEGNAELQKVKDTITRDTPSS